MHDPDTERAIARVGGRIGGFTLERVLGVGGMASVYFGRRADGLVAAVKALHPELAGIDELKKRFLREGPIGSALATLSPLCEGLPRVFESGVDADGTVFLAMEVLDGETIFDRGARLGVLPASEIVWIGLAVLDVLVVAHTHGVVHRDIKPENLHLGRDGRLTVLDFGIARVLDELPAASLPDKTRTRTGVAMGSCMYMAPEQASGHIRRIDGRTDLFSLGATLFHCASGRPVHGDLADARLVIACATQKAPTLASVAKDVPRALCDVVDRALAFAQAERYPDAATMRHDLRAVRAGAPPPYVQAIAERRLLPGERPR